LKFSLDGLINEPLRIAKEQIRILLNRRAKLALSRPHPSASSTALPSAKEKDLIILILFSRRKKKVIKLFNQMIGSQNTRMNVVNSVAKSTMRRNRIQSMMSYFIMYRETCEALQARTPGALYPPFD
jgi:hypothetical protein